jgi:hypothetical protein
MTDDAGRVASSVIGATHVKVDGQIEAIAGTWGIGADGALAKPSEGGFGVITASGRRVGMMEAEGYLTTTEADLLDEQAAELLAAVSREPERVIELRLRRVEQFALVSILVEYSRSKDATRTWEQIVDGTSVTLGELLSMLLTAGDHEPAGS